MKRKKTYVSLAKSKAFAKLNLLTTAAFLAVFFLPADAQARDKIHIVGSSTVYPFTTTVAEEFGKTTNFPTPLVESTGTGGGLKLFCGGIGETFPDIANASRAIKDSERELCAANGVKDISEIKIGFDGIVLANSKKEPQFNLTKEQIFTALAKQIPSGGKLIDNPYQTWNEIDPALPAVKIEVYGPPTTSGTRDAFVELVMDKACANLPAFKTAWPDEDTRKKNCQLIREDGRYIEAGENDNLIIQKLKSNPQALGIFGFSFLEQNMDVIQGSKIDGTEPTFETIVDGSYSISRPLFIYVKNQHTTLVNGLREFTQEFVSEKAAGEDGYLTVKGLVPLPEKDLAAMQDLADKLPASTQSK
jgi:phosphate transport system substrate-binding protein